MSSIAAELLEADKTLGQETNRYWREISNESYIFDRGMRRRRGGGEERGGGGGGGGGGRRERGGGREGGRRKVGGMYY